MENSSTVRKVRQLMTFDSLISTKVIAEELDLDRETVTKIFIEDLDIRTISTMMISRILTYE